MIPTVVLMVTLATVPAGGMPALRGQGTPALERQGTGARPAAPQQAARPQAPNKAQAYYLFLQARRLQDEGNVDGAIKALQEAATYDPSSGDIPAEIASLYVQQHRLRDAITTAESALKINRDTVEAHLVLGRIYAAYAQGEEAIHTAASEKAERDYAARASGHLEAVINARGAAADSSLLLALGRLYIKTAAFDKAIAILTRFNEQEAGTLEGTALLAEAYAQAGQTDAAIRVLEPASAHEPSFYPALAGLYERAGRWNDAADSYQKAVTLGNGSAELKRRWAIALLNAARPGDAAKARELLQQAVQANPKDTRALYLLSQAARQVNDFPAAEAAARQLMALDPNGASGSYALAQVYEQQHQPAKVVETLQPVVDRLGTSATADAGIDVAPLLLHLGFAYIDLDQPDRAIAVLQRARVAAPDNPTVDIGVVQAEIAAKRYSRAVDTARKAQARYPDDTRFARLDAEALRLDGKIDRAVAVLEQSRLVHPDDPAGWVALADLLMSGDRSEQATTLLQQARTKFPDDLSVLFDLGAAYEHQKRYAEAEKAFKEVLARDPLHAQALNYLGYMLAERGQRLAESVDYIRRALVVEPNNPAYLDSLGWAYFKMNRLDLAEQNLRQAAEDRPHDSAVQDHWGDLLLKVGRPDAAIAAWRRALAGDGTDIDRAAIEAKIRAAGEKVRK